MEPEQFEERLARCKELQRAGAFEKALEGAKKLLNVREQRHDVLNLMGICAGELRRYSEAKLYFEEAVRVKPDFVAAHANIAVLASKFDAQEVDDLIAATVRALEMAPGESVLWWNLACLYVLKPDYPNALRALEKHVAIGGDAVWEQVMGDTGFPKMNEDKVWGPKLRRLFGQAKGG